MPEDDPALLNYAAPLRPRGLRDSQRLMRGWRSVAIWGFIFQFSAGIPIGLILLGFISNNTGSLAMTVLAICGFATLLVGSIMTFVHMTRLAADEIGRGYAIRHLILAIALWPILLLGIFVVPALVEEDVIRLREDELRHQSSCPRQGAAS